MAISLLAWRQMGREVFPTNGFSTVSSFQPTVLLLPPWRGMEITAIQGMAAQPRVRVLELLPASRWTVRATFTSQTITASARWEPTASLPPWRGMDIFTMEQDVIPAMAVPPRMRVSIIRPESRWIALATFTSRTKTTSAFAKWEPTASLPPWRGMEIMAIPARALWPPMLV